MELDRHNALLVGAQGLPVVDTALLPKGKWYVSFDQKENLGKVTLVDFSIMAYNWSG
jgi:hypothetical protein